MASFQSVLEKKKKKTKAAIGAAVVHNLYGLLLPLVIILICLWLSEVAIVRTVAFSSSSSSSLQRLLSVRRSKYNMGTTKKLKLSSVDDQNTLLWEWATHTNSSFHHFTEEEAYEIQSALLTWYEKNRRKLPWRGDPPPYDGSTAGINNNNNNNYSSSSSGIMKQHKKKDSSQTNIRSFFQPRAKEEDKDDEIKEENNNNNNNGGHEVTAYGVWVSEIMCQQTRVEAVIPYYLKWMSRFPTVYELANATEEEVNSHWAGLGFYRRARMLHAGAKYVVSKHNGIVPNTVEELLKIDGVGRYTACAVASMAYNVSVPVVDGNVCRVLSRLKGIANHIKSPTLKDKYAWDLAHQLILPNNTTTNAGQINQALMELGATYCAPSGTGIHPQDPLKPYYMSTKLGQQLHYTLTKTDTTLDDFIASAKAVRNNNNKKKCALCSQESNDDNIISTVLYQINDNIQSYNNNPTSIENKVSSNDVAATCGHASFPVPPPKKTKREEVLAVAVILCNNHWLMIKRPNDGLLAKQWEFPSICVWTSAMDKQKEKKKKKISSLSQVTVPWIEPKVRTKEMNQFLSKNIVLSSTTTIVKNNKEQANKFINTLSQKKRKLINTDAALEHIFSHVRHSMWIEYLDLSSMTDMKSVVDLQLNNTKDGREVRWLSDSDLKDVGITSGVKKIFSLVKKKRVKIKNSSSPPSKRVKTED